MSENKNNSNLIDKDELTCSEWKEALEQYSQKHHGYSSYKELLLDLIIKDKLSIEQADWILERIGELFIEDHCGCEGNCCDKGSCGCKSCEEPSKDCCKK